MSSHGKLSIHTYIHITYRYIQYWAPSTCNTFCLLECLPLFSTEVSILAVINMRKNIGVCMKNVFNQYLLFQYLLFRQECQRLGQLFARAVDAAKTGQCRFVRTNDSVYACTYLRFSVCVYVRTIQCMRVRTYDLYSCAP
jgi:hypothetical protein